MAACGSLQQIFESPSPEKSPSLLESFSSWNPSKPAKTSDHSFADLFEDASLNGKDGIDYKDNVEEVSGYPRKGSEGFCSLNSESLQVCTEGLGFESFDGVEDSKNEASSGAMMSADDACARGRSTDQYYRRGKSGVRSFPPPISSLGRSGKPSVCFKSYRQDGRFVLQEFKIPAQQYLHACREDGRLRLSFEQPDDDDDEGDDNGHEGGKEDEDDNQVKDVAAINSCQR